MVYRLFAILIIMINCILNDCVAMNFCLLLHGYSPLMYHFCNLTIPKTYKRALGCRTYQDYSREKQKECLHRGWNVHNEETWRTTCVYRRKLKFETDLPTSAAYAFPFNSMGIRIVVRLDLQKTGRTFSKFKDGILPGDD